jgi:hypothetical protein
MIAGAYIKNIADRPLPIFQAGKIETTLYLQPKERYPLKVQKEILHDDGKVFAVVYPLGASKPFYIYIGQQDAHTGERTYFVDTFTKEQLVNDYQKEIESKEPMKTSTKIFLIAGLIGAGFVLNALSKFQRK